MAPGRLNATLSNCTCTWVPAIGAKALQKLTGADIDRLYAGLEAKRIATSTRHHIHNVLKACLDAAVRAELIARNPVEKVETVPTEGETDFEPLDDDQLRDIVRGFAGYDYMFALVACLALTGMRRNEALALPDRDAQPVVVSAPAAPTTLPPLLPPISQPRPGDTSVPGAVRVGAIIQRQPGRWYRKIAAGPDSEPILLCHGRYRKCPFFRTLPHSTGPDRNRSGVGKVR